MPLSVYSENFPVISPPWKGRGKLIEKLVRKACYEFNLITHTSHIGIALSGGKDSLTLLYMLKNLSGHGFNTFKITAFHVSGAFSCGASIEKDYLQKICDSLNIELITIISDRSIESLECYSCSRERRKLIFKKAKELNIETIAFGHHNDDHIETLMMNLCQKGQLEGNLPKVPMILYGITIIRPLILVQEKDIISFAKSSGFARIMCKCPVGQNSKRKKMKNLIDLVEIEFPHVKNNLSRCGLLFGSQKALREDLIKSKISHLPSKG